MDATPPLAPLSIAILDRRPEYASLLATVLAGELPHVAVRAFHDSEEAERWIAQVSTPVGILADVGAAGGSLMEHAQRWRRGRRDILLVAMFDQAVEDDVTRAARVEADVRLPKPTALAGWIESFRSLLFPAAVARTGE